MRDGGTFEFAWESFLSEGSCLLPAATCYSTSSPFFAPCACILPRQFNAALKMQHKQTKMLTTTKTRVCVVEVTSLDAPSCQHRKKTSTQEGSRSSAREVATSSSSDRLQPKTTRIGKKICRYVLYLQASSASTRHRTSSKTPSRKPSTPSPMPTGATLSQ